MERVEPYEGVLPIDKPYGLTSHDVVDALRRRFGFEKVGHGGTLDPQATGLLILLIGKATKLAPQFIGSDKTYEGTLRLGVVTDTQDAQGRVLQEGDWSTVTRERLEAEMAKRTGDLMQTPPMVSAAKVGGVPLYKRARRGLTVERRPKLIHVYEFRLLAFEPPRGFFRLRCTKGTYVRTLCAEVGEALGCGAHLEQLRRLQAGELTVDQAQPLDRLLALSRDDLIRYIIPLRDLPLHPPGERRVGS